MEKIVIRLDSEISTLKKILKTQFDYVHIYNKQNKIAFGFQDRLFGDVFIEYITNSETENGMFVTVDRSFKDILNILNTCDLQIAKNEIVIKNDYAFKIIKTISVDKPFIFTKELEGSSFSTTGSELLKALKKIKYAISEDTNLKTVYNIHGEIGETNNIYRVVASDGYRLALAEFHIDHYQETNKYALRLNKKQINILTKLLPRNEKIQVKISQNLVAIYANKFTFYFKREIEEFPDYKRVIPSDDAIKTKISFDKKLHDYLKQFNKKSIVIFNTENGKTTITIVDKKTENEILTMNLNATTSGQNIRIAFSMNYFIDLLKNINAQTITLQIVDTEAPIKVTAENELHLLLPIRLT